MNILINTAFSAQLTLQDFFLMILWMALIGLIIMLIAILFRAYQAMRDIRKIIDENRQNINHIMNELPGITKNVGEVTTEASHAAQVMRPSIANIADTTESVTKTIKENNPVNEAIISAYKTVNNVHKLVDSVGKKNNKKVNIDID